MLKDLAITVKIEHYGKLFKLYDLQLVLQRPNDHRDLCWLHNQLSQAQEPTQRILYKCE